MSLKKKIIMGFLISFSLIALLAVFLLMNFVEIKKETTFLELTDTIRSKSLQLRRHEKNYFLYAPSKTTDETKEIYGYLDELDKIADSVGTVKLPQSSSLKNIIREYREQFGKIEMLVNNVSEESNRLGKSFTSYSKISRLIESNFLDRPLEDVEYLKKEFSFRSDHQLISWLRELDVEIVSLRKTGENLLSFSKELDRTARGNVDNFISMAQTAIVLVLSLFFVVGIGSLFLISHSVVKRLTILTSAVEKAGKGDFSPLIVPEKQDKISLLLTKFYKPLPILFSGKPDEVSQLLTNFFKMKSDLLTEQDEVGNLITAFIKMENDLAIRDQEIKKKNEEKLLQNRKLASIGTLASGVAHELNNPLNNIYLAAQVLSGEIKEKHYPDIIKESVQDIYSQTFRVKKIVGNLLEFARGKAPEFQKIDLVKVISGVLARLAGSGELLNAKPNLDASESVEIMGDRLLLEEVFINLFTNAAEEMSGSGEIFIKVDKVDSSVLIKVTDSGKGIPPDVLPRIFDPFFTTKEKGTGLGLAIVYNIIEKHKGKIEVKSGPEKGAVFTIRLPEKQ